MFRLFHRIKVPKPHYKKYLHSLKEMEDNIIKKYCLNQIEKEKLRLKGLTEAEITAADRQTIHISIMNDTDDSYGMRPISREEIIDMASSKPSEKLLENIKKMKEELNELNSKKPCS